MPFQNDHAPQFGKEGIEGSGIGNGGNGGHFPVFEFRKRQTFLPVEHLFQILGAVTALDDFRMVVLPLEKGFQVPQLRGTVGLGEEDIVRPLDVLDGLPQKPPGQDVVIGEGVRGVHKEDIDMGTQFQVLEPVVQDQGIRAEFVDGVKPGLHPVLVHHHRHVFQIGGQHEGLVSGVFGVEKQILPVGNHPGRDLVSPGGKFSGDLVEEGTVLAPVSPAEDGHFPPLPAERSGKNFHHGSFPRAAAGDVADTHHQTADGPVPEHTSVVHPDPHLDRPAVDPGGQEQKPLEGVSRKIMPRFVDDLQKKLFRFFSQFPDIHGPLRFPPEKLCFFRDCSQTHNIFLHCEIFNLKNILFGAILFFYCGNIRGFPEKKQEKRSCLHGEKRIGNSRRSLCVLFFPHAFFMPFFRKDPAFSLLSFPPFLLRFQFLHALRSGS